MKAFLDDNPTLKPFSLKTANNTQFSEISSNLIPDKQNMYILNVMYSEFKLSRIGVALKLFHHWSGVLLYEGSGQGNINVPFNE